MNRSVLHYKFSFLLVLLASCDLLPNSSIAQEKITAVVSRAPDQGQLDYYFADFVVTFSQPIQEDTFQVNDVKQTGTVTASQLQIKSLGDRQNFRLRASKFNGVGTVVPEIVTGAVVAEVDINQVNSKSISNNGFVKIAEPPLIIGSWPDTDNVRPIPLLNIHPAQSKVTNTFPIRFSLMFTEPIDPTSFSAKNILWTGTADGISASIKNSGDNQQFTIEVTQVLKEGTLIPSLKENLTRDRSSSTNSNLASISLDNTVLYISQLPKEKFPLLLIPAQNDWHQTGFKKDQVSWAARASDPPTALSYGPYSRDVPVGQHKVSFFLLTDNITADNKKIAQVDVFDSQQNTIIVQKIINRKMFKVANSFQEFTLFFENKNPQASLEFRVFHGGNAYLEHGATKVTSVNEGALGRVFKNKAHFVKIAEAKFPTTGKPDDPDAIDHVGMNTGSSFVTVGNRWYIFHREGWYAPKPSYCFSTRFRMVVRYSDNQGRSWSEKSVVAEPKEGSADECVIADGAPFYDEQTQFWHLMAQCQGRDLIWRGCHYFRYGPSPMGAFTRNANNPVIQSGALWSRICTKGSNCPTGVNEEGTFQIIKKDQAGFYYVTFHGARTYSNTIWGYRGIAKSKDFVNWVVSDSDDALLPGKAIFTPDQCAPWNANWNGSCIGGGQASMLQSGDYSYMLIEAADLGLNCTPGQNWFLGLYRTPAHTVPAAGSWEAFGQNPFVRHTQRRQACAIQYQSLFQDIDGTYLSFWAIDEDSNSKMYIYKVADGPGSTPVYDNQK